ncbi:retrovirus-related pol polyprotein from transposon TNT 1-94, partial [Tanacetum coccineum]
MNDPNITMAEYIRLEEEKARRRGMVYNWQTATYGKIWDNEDVIQIILWYLDSGCSKHMTGDRSRLMNFVKKFIGAVRFGNDHFGAIMGYGDYVIGDSVISRVYYVEGLGHNLFSVGQFCDSDLEVAFRKHSCYVRNTDGVELLKGSRGSNLYTISVEDMMKSSPICLLSKASKHKSWTVRFGNDHFGAIIGYRDYVVGDSVISKVYYVEGPGHNLFSVGQFYDSDLEVAFRKHSCYVRDTDCVELLKGSSGSNLYIISVEDMMKSSPICLLSKASKNKSWLWHRRLNHLNFGTINDLARKDLTLYDYYDNVGIFHQKTVPRTPQQNGVVERQNRTLVEAARTMLIFSKAPMFLWAEAVATACYIQNHSLIHKRHDKTPYELVHNKNPDLTFFWVFGALCYPTNDSENLGKVQPRADIGIFIGYAPSRKGPAPNLLTPGPISSGLVPNPAHVLPYVPPTNKELEMLFQPMFDEYFNPPGNRQDPLPQCEQYVEVNPFAAADHEPFANVFAPDPTSEASS